MVVLKRKANVGVSAVLIVLTVFMKIRYAAVFRNKSVVLDSTCTPSLTRFCRAKFERDDLLEAQIICGSLAPNTASQLLDDHDQDAKGEKGKSPASRSRIHRWTWKLSNRVGISYRTVIHHQRSNQRPPNPFARPSADSTIPLEPCASTAGLLTKIDTTASAAMLTDEPLYESPAEEDPPTSHDDSRPALVVNHPPLLVWDDDSNPDTPYDNPYYTRLVGDTLWLPRDPLGILNLDDTVDLRMALTSEPGAGKLGAWQDDEFLYSAISSAFVTSFDSVDDDLGSIQPPLHAEDSDVLTLPPSSTSRVGSVERPRTADDSVRRPSLRPPRRPSHTSETGDGRSSSRRPAPLRDRPSSAGYRSFSLGGDSFATRPDASSHLSVPDTMHRRQRSASVDALSVGLPSASRSPLSAGSQGLRSVIRMPSVMVPGAAALPTAPSMISTREVVVSEAIAEEQVAAQRRQRQETADEERAREPRSWLTSWIYAKGQ